MTPSQRGLRVNWRGIGDNQMGLWACWGFSGRFLGQLEGSEGQLEESGEQLEGLEAQLEGSEA